MTICIHILGDSECALWGLSGRARLQGQLRHLTDVLLLEEAASPPPNASVLYLRGDYLFDTRLLRALLGADAAFILLARGGQQAVALRVPSEIIDRDISAMIAKAAVLFSGPCQAAEMDLPTRSVDDLVQAHDQAHDLALKKYDALLLLPISNKQRPALERELFAASYKGVTDLVTKWLWPLPARLATRLCVHYGIQPNQLTLASLGLAVLAALAFWHGYFGSGLLLGWGMTFLDTVDGKLARVTLRASKVGNVLDHGLDLIHPPFWYWAWAVGLGAGGLLAAPLSLVVWLIFLGYIGGRVCEGIFELWLTRFSIFIWRELDSFHRLITARRNPNMLLLTACYMGGRPDLGLYALIIWQLVCTLFLAWRVLLAWQTRRRDGALVSWLETIDPERDRHRLAVSVFTRRPMQ